MPNAERKRIRCRAISLTSENGDAVVKIEQLTPEGHPLWVEVIRTPWACDGTVSHIVEALGVDECLRRARASKGENS